MHRVRAGLVAVVAIAAVPVSAYSTTFISGAQGLSISVDTGGAYEIQVPSLSWDFQGTVGALLANITVTTGTDGAGDYAEIAFDFQTDAPRHAAIRAYQNRQAVLFTLTCPGGVRNSFAFPNLSRYPSGLNHLAFSGTFAQATFTSMPYDSPWMFFDSSGHAFMVSAARNFMVSQNNSGPNGEIQPMIAPSIQFLPAGFTHQVLLVADSGINRTFEAWGQTLMGLAGKVRPPNDADISLARLSYWTDNGANYYYHTENTALAFAPIAPAGLATPYETTLLGVKAKFDAFGIGLGSMQLDSWFYPKGPNMDWSDAADGIYQYVASPTLFGAGLAAFQQRLNLPLITHARWLDTSSPDRQLYTVSGNVATDPQYWRDTASYLKSAGVAVYEQDWLSAQAHTDFNLVDPDLFLDGMANAMAEQGIDMQYCMATPHHFLEASKYGNLTSIRASGDRFDSSKWSSFLYASRLAGAVGVWPFSDVFMSSETGNLLLATLSAGPLGVGDRIGSIDGANLLRAVRQDGVIVKPDVSATPLDSSFLHEAQADGAPMIASTYTDFGGARTYYLFGYPRSGSSGDAQFALAETGASGAYYLYDSLAGAGRVVAATDTLDWPIANGFGYLVAAPVGSSGIAMLGDAGQFVSMGRKRIADYSDDGTVRLTVLFAAGETTRILQGYSPNEVRVTADHGAARLRGYDAAAGLFRVAVSPGADGTATIELRQSSGTARTRR